MAQRTAKDKVRSVPVGSVKRRTAEKRSSTSKAKKTRSTARYFEVKIRLTADEHARGLPYYKEEKLLSRYVVDAYLEKINRSEANDKAARLRILAGNMELLEPVLKEMHAQGKLAFLSELKQENVNG